MGGRGASSHIQHAITIPDFGAKLPNAYKLFAKVYGAEHAKGLLAAMEDAPDWYKATLDYCLSKANPANFFKSYGNPATLTRPEAFYSNSTKGITINIDWEKDDGRYGAVFHEYGHLIDNYLYTNYFSSSYDGWISESREYLNNDWARISDYMRSDFQKGYEKWAKKVNKAGGLIEKNGMVFSSSKTDYVNYIVNSVVRKRGHRDIDTRGFSDMLGSITYQFTGDTRPISYGHDQGYWNTWGTDNTSIEAFAQIMKGVATGRKSEEYRLINKYFPSAVKVAEKKVESLYDEHYDEIEENRRRR